MATENSQPESDIDIDAEIAALFGEPDEERVQVVLGVPNGLMHGGQPMFVPTVYAVTTTTLMQAQALLENGSKLNVPDAMSRATAAIRAVVKDADTAHEVAAHLVELDLLK